MLSSGIQHNPPQSPISLVIVEDHELTRSGLVYTLSKYPGIHIAGEFDNGREAVHYVSEHPDCFVLMDLGLPQLDGVSATQQIKQLNPSTKVVILTSHQESEEVFAAFAAGADGYCMKDISVERLVQVIELVKEGGIWLDPAIARLVVAAAAQSPQHVEGMTPPFSPVPRGVYPNNLTNREIEVLTLIVNGLSNKEISRDLCISLHTVKAHVCSIIQKLSVDDRTQAAVKALKEGLV